MTIMIKLFIIILNIIYLPLKLFKTKNKITFISRQSNSINVDFKLLIDDLNERYSNYEIVVLTKKIESGIINKIKYVFHIFRQMYHIATSKVVILDTYCIPISILKHKKNLKVIQMWHALGAFKKFGLSIKDKKEGSSSKLIDIMKMHQNYDYIFSSSEYCSNYFAEAFGYNKEKVLPYPLPRLDLLNDKKYIKNKKEEIYSIYPELKDKKNIIYAPTFRIENNGMDRKKSKSTKYLKKLIDEVDFNKYNLIIKFHPLSNIDIEDDRVIIDKNFSTTNMFLIGDYIITDYSAVVYEASFLNKPLFFYSYDLEEYTKNRDFYLDLKKDLPGIISKDSKNIIEAIEKEKYDLKVVKDFSKKNIKKRKKTYTKDINDFIVSIID